tara:strand:- start:114 stop:284 length:171 start_codon:yes stop_codon:yes gene_type:complete
VLSCDVYVLEGNEEVSDGLVLLAFALFDGLFEHLVLLFKLGDGCRFLSGEFEGDPF